MGSWGFCTFGAGIDVTEIEKQNKTQAKFNSDCILVLLVFLHIYEKPEEMTCMNYTLNVNTSNCLKIPQVDTPLNKLHIK